MVARKARILLLAGALAVAPLATLVIAQIPGRIPGSTSSNAAKGAGSAYSKPATSENAAGEARPTNTGGWRASVAGDNASSSSANSSRAAAPDSAREPARVARTEMQPIDGVRPSRVSEGDGTLPGEHGQVWREYDISAYTHRVTSTNRPEQAIVDWILRETGYEAWHGEPVALLSANKRALRVYHTPEMQATVGDIVQRFVDSEAETHAYSIRVVSLDTASWRAKAQRMLKPVNVQTQGVQAWLLAKEDAALLQGELRKRNDYREHSSPHLLVSNGQTGVATAVRTRNYVRGVILSPEAWPGFQPQQAQIDEGYSLELSPLLSQDGRTIDAIIKCNLDQLEKLHPVALDVPTAATPRQRTQIDVPQLSSFRLHERFRFPAEQVLLIGCGLVAPPVPADPQIRLPLVSVPLRVDLLIFVESRGPHGKPPVIPQAATSPLAITPLR
jgi:hypothetical protein